MQEALPNFSLLRRLWQHIETRRRKHFALLLILIVATSLADIVSIGLVLPFLAVISDPAGASRSPILQSVADNLDLRSTNELLLTMTIAFCAAALLATAMRLLLLKATVRLSFAVGADISNKMFRNSLYQPYTVHLRTNSSELITGVLIKGTATVGSIITPLLTLASAFTTLLSILAALMIIEPFIALSSLVGFGAIYAAIGLLTRNQLARNGTTVADEYTRITKVVQEGLGGIRDIIISGSQSAYCEDFRTADSKLRRAQSGNAFLIGSPRYAIEGFGMLLIAVMAYLVIYRGDGSAIPILGAFALGAQRMLPALQQAYWSWSTIRAEQASLRDTLAIMDLTLPASVNASLCSPITFTKEISLENVSVKYDSQGPWILRELNITIEKGKCVGFIGPTGSGKSTLLDIVMGLLDPTSGALSVDGQRIEDANRKAWQRRIACVSQTIFLGDCSIEENIAFGITPDDIDRERVRRAAKQASISSDIESFPQGYATVVGERGVRLSGGQRQRIGIARALYRQADVLVFDEATSALDTTTEEAVMSAIANLDQDLTILIVAHRLSTLKVCDRIIELAAGSINRVGTYQSMAGAISFNHS